MFFGGGEDEYGMCRRLLERLEKGVECGGGKHVYLIDYEHAVSTHCRWYKHLVDKGFHVVDAVVRGGVQFDDVE